MTAVSVQTPAVGAVVTLHFRILASPFPLLLAAVLARGGCRTHPLHLRGETNVIARQVSISRRPAPDARVFHHAPDGSADYGIFVRSRKFTAHRHGAQRDKVICPSGWFAACVSSPICKNISIPV